MVLTLSPLYQFLTVEIATIHTWNDIETGTFWCPHFGCIYAKWFKCLITSPFLTDDGGYNQPCQLGVCQRLP